MSKTLSEIAQQLKNTDKEVQPNKTKSQSKRTQLIYAFNGTGKTRLSQEFKHLVYPKQDEDAMEESTETPIKLIYYNSFTEDLFYWEHSQELDTVPKLIIQPNNFINWILEEEGREKDIEDNFKHYINKNLNLKFEEGNSYVSFSSSDIDNLKLSKGEESIFIWSIFYTLIRSAIDSIKEYGDESDFKLLEYVFIDDPVSSLDDNHLVELAIDLSKLIKEAPDRIKFIITTHNPLFYNVLCNSIKSAKRWLFKNLEDGSYILENQNNDSPFSYHLYLKNEIENAINNNQIMKYHFHFMRHLLEKTSTFLGYDDWTELLPNNDNYETMILNLSSHSKQSGEEITEVKEKDKDKLRKLMDSINEKYHFKL
jgi:anticodon nuclease prrC